MMFDASLSGDASLWPEKETVSGKCFWFSSRCHCQRRLPFCRYVQRDHRL